MFQDSLLEYSRHGGIPPWLVSVCLVTTISTWHDDLWELPAREVSMCHHLHMHTHTISMYACAQMYTSCTYQYFKKIHIYIYIWYMYLYIYIWPCACARLHAFLVQNAFKQDPIQVPDRIHFSTARSNTSSCCSFPWSCPACRGKAQSFSGSGDSCGYGMPMGCLWDAWYPGGHLEMVGRWLISGLSSPQIWFVIGLEPSISFFRRF